MSENTENFLRLSVQLAKACVKNAIFVVNAALKQSIMISLKHVNIITYVLISQIC